MKSILALSILAVTYSLRSAIDQSPIQLVTNSPLLSFHRELIEHESITGNEGDVGHYLASYLEKHDFSVETQLVEASDASRRHRRNIFAYKGTQRKTRILVTSHIDVVPPFWPYKRVGDEIWGRGSVDAKGSVAAQVIAVEELVAAGSVSEGDVALLFVVGEETTGDGMKTANSLELSWETVIFGEPTELKLASGHKGITMARIKAKGKAAHSGYPELGKNANAILIPALSRLLRIDLPRSEKYGNTTLNIGRMEGGVAANVIPEDAEAQVAIRIADGTPENVQDIVLKVVQSVDEELDVTFGAGYGPVHIDSDIEGFESMVVNYGTDIPHLEGSHKRYLYGPGSILVAHSDHEHVKISDLEEAVKGYKKIIESSLR